MEPLLLTYRVAAILFPRRGVHRQLRRRRRAAPHHPRRRWSDSALALLADVRALIVLSTLVAALTDQWASLLRAWFGAPYARQLTSSSCSPPPRSPAGTHHACRRSHPGRRRSARLVSIALLATS
jgi:hypothetical protein